MIHYATLAERAWRSVSRWIPALAVAGLTNAAQGARAADQPPQVLAIESAFRKDPRTLYATPESVSTDPHLASSEFDWVYDDWTGVGPIDVVVGFGTNSAYDVALAQKARGLVIVDHAIEPLLVHAYILAPFFVLANSRTEFLGLLRGRDLRPERQLGAVTDNYSAAELFDYVKGLPSIAQRGKPDTHILRRVRQGFGATAAELVNGYYNNLVLKAKADTNDADATSRLSRKPYPSMLRSELSDQMQSLFQTMQNYYGIVEAHLNAFTADRSFLFNEERYQALRRLFLAGRVRFALADVGDRELYSAVAIWLKELGLDTVSISTSNIFDLKLDVVNTSDLNRDYVDFVRSTCNLLLEKGVRLPIHFRQTRGWNERHRFEHHDVTNPNTVRLHLKPVSWWIEKIPFRLSPSLTNFRRVVGF